MDLTFYNRLKHLVLKVCKKNAEERFYCIAFLLVHRRFNTEIPTKIDGNLYF